MIKPPQTYETLVLKQFENSEKIFRFKMKPQSPQSNGKNYVKITHFSVHFFIKMLKKKQQL